MRITCIKINKSITKDPFLIKGTKLIHYRWWKSKQNKRLAATAANSSQVIRAIYPMVCCCICLFEFIYCGDDHITYGIYGNPIKEFNLDFEL